MKCLRLGTFIKKRDPFAFSFKGSRAQLQHRFGSGEDLMADGDSRGTGKGERSHGITRSSAEHSKRQ
jgi:hypothetical protein